jgi:uncharacterized LabA/DUF88 family protein
MIISSGRTPHYEKVMGFIDGSNFLIELAKELGVGFRADKLPLPALEIAQNLTNRFFCKDGNITIRKYWFASYQGDETYFRKYAKELREHTFEPVLFKKHDGKEKGVDIALATEMLVNAFNQNYDIGVIVAGDKDYVGLVKEVKRYGPIIVGSFFRHGLSDDFALAVDNFSDIMDGVRFDSEFWKTQIEAVRNASNSSSV